MPHKLLPTLLFSISLIYLIDAGYGQSTSSSHEITPSFLSQTSTSALTAHT